MSLLEKVRASRFQEEISRFNPAQAVLELLQELSQKEREIILRRTGLVGKGKETLEEIGRTFKITRERVRQIELLALKRLKELRELKEQIKLVERLVVDLLAQYGGVMSEEHFLENLLSYLEEQKNQREALLFIIRNLLSPRVQYHRQSDHWHDLWRLEEVSLELLQKSLENLVEFFQQVGRPLSFDELLEKFSKQEFYQKNLAQFLAVNPYADAQPSPEATSKILEAQLHACRHLASNLFEEWGLHTWGTIIPKNINDKIYLIMKKEAKPLHFREIARLINEAQFDEKVAYPATTHNELILDERYILVGRGIYALREHGFRPGTVEEVIVEILKEANRPLTRAEITQAVLKQRQVKTSTIYLALMKKNKFKKLSDGHYTLVPA